MITIRIENNNNNHNNIITLKKEIDQEPTHLKRMFWFQPQQMWFWKHTYVIFQCCYLYIATHVDTTDVAANMPCTVLEKDTMHILPIYIYCAGRLSTSHLKTVRGAGWILKVIYHVSTLLCTHLTWRIVCFLNIRLKLQKETKGEKKRECTALQECLLSLRRFLELTGLYSLWLIIISGLQMRKWSFVGRLGMGSDCCCEEWGHRARAWRRAAFSFQVFSAVKNENKESSTVWKLNPCWVCLFLRVEKLYLCSIFSPCVFLCLCVATEDSILLLLTLVVFLPLELLFIYYKATILWRCSQHLHSINNPESVMPSKRQYLLNSAHTTCRQNHSIWFLTLLTHLYILFLFNNIRQLLESKQALPLIYFSPFLFVFERSTKGMYSTQKPFKGIKFPSTTIKEECESSPQKYIEPLIN